jgi:hypothetical protein
MSDGAMNKMSFLSCTALKDMMKDLHGRPDVKISASVSALTVAAEVH